MRKLAKRFGTRYAAVALAFVVAGGGIAFAAIPGADRSIQACYAANGGQLRVIDASTSSCKKNENPLSWSQTGSGGTAEPWHEVGAPGEPTFTNGYANFGYISCNFCQVGGETSTAAFYRDGDRVYLKGSVTRADGFAPAGSAFTLPPGYRPAQPLSFVSMQAEPDNPTAGRMAGPGAEIRITPAGEVFLPPVWPQAYQGLDAVAFRAA